MPLDKLHREIHVGDYIAYGHLLSRSAGIRIGKVLAIKPRKSRRGSTKEENFTITVIGIDDDWHLPKLCSTTGNLLYPDRIVVIDKSSLSDEYVTLLDSYDK